MARRSSHPLTYNSSVAHTFTTRSHDRPAVLVLTLNSGEAEYGRCRESLESQTYTAWEHRTFENLPNTEAHAQLYETIMAERELYELFLKLDADMILADGEVLADLVRVFEDRPDLDHLVVGVNDWMTDSSIIGAHLFSNRVRWQRHAETLYVDPDPAFPGCKLVVDNPPRNLILHAGDPSPLQAFHFGAHRALQASQVYRRLRDARPHNARIQWQYLDRVWRHFERSGDRRLGLAMLAADMVFRKELPSTANEYSDAALLAAFDGASSLDDGEIRARLDARWGSHTARRQTWVRALGPVKSVLVTLRGLRDAAASVVKSLLGLSRPTVEIGTGPVDADSVVALARPREASMTVALLSHLASISAPTGAERVLELLGRGLRDRGHRVAVSAPGQWDLAPALQAADVDVRSIPIRCCWLVQADRQPAWWQLVRGVRYLLPDPGVRALKAFLGEFEPDVVHVNCLPHLRGAAAARAGGFPVVWHIHEILPPGARRRWFAGRLRRDATRIVAVSEAVAEWLREENLGASLEVVHNGVDAPRQLPDREHARREFGLPTKATVIGLFSQLVAHKGAIEFVRAAHQTASSNPHLWFLIAGHGPARFVGQLRRAIADGPAAGRIRMLPPQAEIWPLLMAVDVAAITTLWPDPLPRVVMEAMAVGRPVVGYGGGGVPEMVVDGETGRLCRPGDIEDLARAILELAGDEALCNCLGEAGRRRARELFSVEHHVSRMEAVLRGAASTRSP